MLRGLIRTTFAVVALIVENLWPCAYSVVAARIDDVITQVWHLYAQGKIPTALEFIFGQTLKQQTCCASTRAVARFVTSPAG